MNSPFACLQPALNDRVAAGLLRQRHVLESAQSVEVTIDGRHYLSFSSNDYLGLAADARLMVAAQRGIERFGVGAGAAHLVTGHTQAHHRLEQMLAELMGKPETLLFSSGYMANIGVLQALLGKGDAVFADRLNHASLNDAMQLSRATVKRYRHVDMDQLEALLAASRARRRLVISDAVFSMDGDLAPLPQLLALCERYDAWLLLDDAHGFGVLGERGQGSMAHWRLDSPRIIYMATLGKAAGVGGAFVAAESLVIQTLLQQARTYVYTTAAPPVLAAALQLSLELIAQGAALRQRLQQNIAYLRRGLEGLPWSLMPSDTAIQPLLIGDNQRALRLSQQLREQGIWVAAIRPPTVPEGTARLRITLSAGHGVAQLDRLIEALYALAA